MVSVNQRGIKYHFWVFGMTRQRDWTLGFPAISKNSTHKTNISLKLKQYTEVVSLGSNSHLGFQKMPYKLGYLSDVFGFLK